MTNYFVTRHKGAINWAKEQGIEAKHIAHLEPEIIKKGDMVLGTLPVSVAAEVIEQGARYLHLTFENLPQSERGRELSASEMQDFGAKLEEYEIRRV